MAKKQCTKCHEIKGTMGFSRRKQKRKDGEPMYLSQCKKCGVKTQKERTEKKRLANLTNICEICGSLCSSRASKCLECKKGIRNSPIAKKWLVRGSIHNGSNDSTIMNGE